MGITANSSLCIVSDIIPRSLLYEIPWQAGNMCSILDGPLIPRNGRTDGGRRILWRDTSAHGQGLHSVNDRLPDSLIELVLQVIGGVLCLLSLAIWAHVAWCLKQNRLPVRRQERPDRKVPAGAVLVAAAWSGFQLVLRLAGRPNVPSLPIIQGACLTNLVLWGVLAGLLIQHGGRLWDFGLHLRSPRDQTRLGVTAFLASLLPVYGTLWITFPIRHAEDQHVMLQLLRSAPTVRMVFWIGLAALVLAPMVEELLFRVILQSWLRPIVGWRGSILITAALFASVHGLPDALPLFPLALVLGYIFERAHSYWSVVIVHALFNGFNLILALF